MMALFPGQRLVFDHVHKTGGLAISGALHRALPRGTMSPHFNPNERPVPEGDIPKWRHIAGHFGFKFRHLVPHFGSACTATVIRDPAAGVVSTYTFWRYNIPRNYGDHVARAHDLGLSDFIRYFSERPGSLDRQSHFLAGPPHGDPVAFAQDALAPYAIVGVTDDLAGFLTRVLAVTASRKASGAADLLAVGGRNASLQRVEPSADDLAYLAERQPYDRALYAEALRRAGMQA
jgi:hypothetical protein